MGRDQPIRIFLTLLVYPQWGPFSSLGKEERAQPLDTTCITEPCLGVVVSGRNAKAQTWINTALACFKQRASAYLCSVTSHMQMHLFYEVTAIPGLV